jgi:hypothetical protein
MRSSHLILGPVALLAFSYGTYVMLEGGWFGAPIMAAAVLLVAAQRVVGRRRRR